MKIRIKVLVFSAVMLMATLLVASAHAQYALVRVAVAANFKNPMDLLIEEFTYAYPNYSFEITYGATGDFLNEITTAGQGYSPYDLLIAANTDAPSQLKTDGYAPATDNVTNYANGSLVLYANSVGGLVVGPDTATAEALLTSHTFTGKLVVAEPTKAPYGAAAKEVLLTGTINKNNQYVLQSGAMNTANVDVEPDIGAAFTKVNQNVAGFPLGFVAHSEVCKLNVPTSRLWIVPQSLYTPLVQAAIVLSSQHGAGSTTGAEAFLNYIKTNATARKIITDYCYSLPVQ
jgi:molybdenum ABC transporter molybdate-binding protein